MSKENPNELKIINKNERLKYQKLLYKYKQQIAELKAENEMLCAKYNVYTWGDKIEQDKIYAVSGEALEFLIKNQN